MSLDHYELIGAEHWRQVRNWPGWCLNFTPYELRSRGADASPVWVNAKTLWLAQKLRDRLGPLVVNSGYRTEAHNRDVGGASDSMHRYGRAIDFALDGRDIGNMARVARAIGFTGIGFYDTFIHVDTGPKRTWDKRS